MSNSQSSLIDSSLTDLLLSNSFQKLEKVGMDLTSEQREHIKRLCQPILLDSLLLDLFQELRRAGMDLTLEQYGLLKKAVGRGYGLGGWDDIKSVCRLLWVKPCANYDASIFDRTFDSFVKLCIEKHRIETPVKVQPKQLEDISPSVLTKPFPNLPQIPPRKRRIPSTEEKGKTQVPTALQTSSPYSYFEDKSNKFNEKNKFDLNLKNFPIQLRDVQVTWRLLKRPVKVGNNYELDIRATLARIEQEGIFTDLVMRPAKTRRTEMLLLIDKHSAMIPFFPAFNPFIQAIAQNRITPAQIYSFTSYPKEYLDHWHHPSKVKPLTDLLSNLHRSRTIALILSDAGAATGTNSQEIITGISNFLVKLSPCIRQLIWLNPLPPQRWEQTSAWSINGVLNDKMLTYEPVSLQMVAKENSQESIINTWQTYLRQQ